MKTAFLDTNILIDYFDGQKPAKDIMEQYETIKLPAVTYIEFMAGLKTQAQIDTANHVITALFDIVQTNIDICVEAASLRQRLRLKLPDLMIYATSLVERGVLITRNSKDFTHDGESVIVPY